MVWWMRVNFTTQVDRFEISNGLNKNLVFFTMTKIFWKHLVSCLTVQCGYGRSVVVFTGSCFFISLCHPDGTMQNTAKSKLLVELEKWTNYCCPRTINIRIFDGMFFQCIFLDLPRKGWFGFGPLEKLILQQVCK